MLFDPVGQCENRLARVGIRVRGHERRARVGGGAQPWIERELGPDGYAGFLFEALAAVPREELGHMAALRTRMADHVRDQRDGTHGSPTSPTNGLGPHAPSGLGGGRAQEHMIDLRDKLQEPSDLVRPRGYVDQEYVQFSPLYIPQELP